jgi:trehalose 6-phosphate phosphatase
MKALRQARKLIAENVRGLRRIWIEDKGRAFAVHYRRAPIGIVRQGSTVVYDVLRRFQPALTILLGKEVWEILPRGLQGKGAAVIGLMSELPAGTIPVYLGDDVTDESAFAALPDGITIRVGPSRLDSPRSRAAASGSPHALKSLYTNAAFILRSPREVREFLERVDKEVSEHHATSDKNGKIDLVRSCEIVL